MASKRVTVFGGSGFLGRQIVKSLAAEGMNVRVGVRHPESASFLERFVRGGEIELVMADVTLKQGVAREIQRVAPGITNVLDVTDHAGGTNPYY